MKLLYLCVAKAIRNPSATNEFYLSSKSAVTHSI